MDILITMPTHNIIEAILDMEEKARTAAESIERERDKLPARMRAEVEHIRDVVSRETEVEISELYEDHEESIKKRISDIWEEGAKRLVDLEFDFAKHRERLKNELWTQMLKG